jgi:hypothetical protein
MSDEPTRRRADEAASRSAARRPPKQLIQAVRESLHATVVYASALSDRFELSFVSESSQVDRIPPDLLLHIAAVSEAFQDGARHTLWSIEPELARITKTVASLARDRAGEPPAGDAR